MKQTMTKGQIMYKNLRRLSLRSLVLCLVTAAFGCASRDSIELTGLRDASALKSESKGKNDLVTVSSLYVAKISSLPEVKAERSDVDGFYGKLVDAFTVEAGIDVFRDPTAALRVIETNPGASEVAQRAKEAGADAVLTTTISKYGSKEGSALGSTRAALLAAQFKVVRLSDGKEIWSSNYFSTEHPNTYNLIEVTRRLGRDRGTELPAFSVLAHEAAKRAALDFATRRMEQFTKR